MVKIQTNAPQHIVTPKNKLATISVGTKQPAGEGFGSLRQETLVTGGNVSAPTDRKFDYYLVITTQSTLVLPAPTPGGSYSIKSIDPGDNPSTISSTSIEDGTSLQIYGGESIDLYPVNGMWRVF